jgi:hypothetical protein
MGAGEHCWKEKQTKANSDEEKTLRHFKTVNVMARSSVLFLNEVSQPN